MPDRVQQAFGQCPHQDALTLVSPEVVRHFDLMTTDGLLQLFNSILHTHRRFLNSSLFSKNILAA